MMTKWTSGSSTRFHPCFPHFVGFVLAFLVLETTSLTVHSQTPITPSGLNTGVNLSPTPPPGKVQYDITGGTRPGGGVNLFHSFGEFGVPTTNIANFLNDSGLQTANILGRITGGNVSSIFGTIQTTGFGAANLFLMNPAGFLFGPNATVNIGGMMTFTTADYLTLRELDGSNAGAFHADPAQTSMLTSAPVAAFGFIGSNPNAITFEGGQLTVVEGTGLALVGGNINVLPDTSGTPSGITAPGRAINIASVGGSGEVGVDTVPQTGMLLGTITLGQGTTLSTVGDPSFGDGSGGEVFIRGGQLVATLATIITSPAEGSTGSGGNVLVDVSSSGTLSDTSVMTNSLFAGAGGSVSITARAGLTATNTIIDTTTLLAFGNSGETTLVSDGQLSMTDSTINTRSDFSGNGGDVTVTGMEVTLGGTHIITDVFTDPSFGPDMVSAGAVTITGHESATISGMDSTDPIITSTAMGTLLDAGSILITSKTVNLSTGLIDAGVGDGGIITPSNGGTIEVRGNRISLSQFQLTSTSSGFQESTGAGGTIRLRGADNLGAESVNLSASRLSANATTGGGGGNIEFHTRQLTASEQTQITTSSFNEGAGGAITVRGAEQVTIESESRVLTDVVGIEGLETRQGTAGNILVETQSLNVLTGGQIRASALPSSTGNAGNITVHGAQNVPAQSVLIDGFGSGIFTDTQGTGAGGNIFVNANSVTLSNSGILSATTSGTESSAAGGTITVDANQVQLTDQAQITASSSGAGNAGTITLTAAQSIALLGSSSILSAAESSGNGGLVSLVAPAIEMSGNSNIVTSTLGLGNAGNVNLQGNQVTLIESFITAGTQAEGRGGDITIRGINGNNASDVTLSQSSTLVTETIGDGVNLQGDAGSIRLDSGRVSLSGGSLITTDSRGSTGAAGDITVNATNSVDISGLGSGFLSRSTEFSFGNAGQVSINASSVVVENGGRISTVTGLVGSAGTITVNTNNLQLLSGGHITSSSVAEFPEFPPAGEAGTVTIQGLASSTQTVLIDGSGSGIFTNTEGTGAGGNILVNANAVMLQNGGTLSATTSGTEPTAIGGTITIDANQVQVNSGSLITASTTGAGAGGSVNINAASTFASNAGMVSSTATQATGGDINITSGQSVTLDNGSLITASSTGEGNAGNIVINAGQSYTSTNSSVTTKAEQASGGNISVLATGLVQLTNSELNASVQGSSTTVGGNILIDPLYVILQNSKIVATATQGQGGNINIFYTGAFLADPSTVIDASSQFGQSGTVTIQSPISPASGKIIPIGQKPLIATSLFSQRCAALAGGNISSFTVAGRDTLPSEPGDWLSTPVALAAPGPGVAQEAKGEGDGSHQIDEIDQTNQTNEFPLLSLRQIAPLGFLIQTFAIDDTDCRS